MTNKETNDKDEINNDEVVYTFPENDPNEDSQADYGFLHFLEDTCEIDTQLVHSDMCKTESPNQSLDEMMIEHRANEHSGWGIENAYSVLLDETPELQTTMECEVAQKDCCGTESYRLNNAETYISNERQANTDVFECSETKLKSNRTEEAGTSFECVECVLTCLRSAHSSRKKWQNISSERFATIALSEELLRKETTKSETLECLVSLSEKVPELKNVRKSWSKSRLSKLLFDVLSEKKDIEFGNGSRKGKIRTPTSLKKLAFDTVKTFPKDTLLSCICEDKWEKKVKTWRQGSPYTMLDVYDAGETHETMAWFSKPHVDIKGKVRYHFTDCSHILTCLRTKVCTSGISGLKRQAWIDAALSEDTSLNVGIVVECLDKQSVAYAKRVFGEDVETFMRKEGNIEEADFVHVIRHWFEAEDDAGIPASDRCIRRLALRQYLLDKCELSSFPYTTQYIGGIPIVTFEALLTHIERKIQIYASMPAGKGYNVRSLGYQEVEQFFSTMRDLDPSGIGTPKPDDIPDIVAKAAFIDNVRLDPERGVYMTTAKSAVYPESVYHTNEDGDMGSGDPTGHIRVRDHFFDTNERKRVKAKRKSGLVSQPECPAKRQRGVRQFHSSDESKVLAHIRKGLSDI